MVGVEGKPWRITGITFRGSPEGNPDTEAGRPHTIHISGTCKNWRIDHCAFFEVGNALAIAGFTYGLIDHCDFKDTILNKTGAMLFIAAGWDRSSWTRPLSLGTAEALYIEDCTFELPRGNCVPFQLNFGSRGVFRHCLTNGQIELTGAATGGDRGAVSYEIYDNIFGGPPRSGTPHILAVTGGTGVIFDNQIQSSCYPSTVVFLRVYRNLGPYDVMIPGLEPHHIKSPCDGSSIIDGNLPYDATATGKHAGGVKEAMLNCADANWAPNRWVGFYIWNVTGQSRGKITANTANTVTAALEPVNIGTDKVVAFPEPKDARYTWEPGDVFKITNGYPALDQVGRTIGTEEALGLKVQKSEPLYGWNNLVDGKTKVPFVVGDAVCEEHLKEGRDFFSDKPKPGYKPFPYPHPLQSVGD